MKITKTLFITAMSALAVSAASAVDIKLGYGSHHAGSGGEFAVTAVSGDAASAAFVSGTAANYSPLALHNGGFETFCLEYYEHFSPGSTYESQVTPGAIKGGTATSDPVSIGTAYLYSLFATGNAALGYDYNDSASAKALQDTIWWLEGDKPKANSAFDAVLAAEFGAQANWNDDNGLSLQNGLVNAASYGVAALNLGGLSVWPNQDQLIYQGGGFTQVPDGGATLMLLGMAMSGVMLLKRKLA